MPPKGIHSCQCSNHEVVSQQTHSSDSTKLTIYNLVSGKKVKKSLVSSLTSRGILPSRCKYICSSCVQHYDNEPSVAKRQKTSPSIPVEEICRAIVNDEYSDEDLCKLGESLGTVIPTRISSKSTKYNDFETLETLNTSDLLSSFDSVLVSFMLGILKGSSGTNSNVDSRVISALEHVYYIMNKHYIGPLNFAMNLVTHFITGSKTAIEIRAKHSPAGSYSTVMKFLDANCNAPTDSPIPANGDGVLFFDNNQVLVRNWNVTYDSKALVSVVTTLLFIQPPIASDLQKNPELSPFIWVKNAPTDLSFIINRPDEIALFREERNKFISSLLTSLYNDQTVEHGEIHDSIDITTPTCDVPETITEKQAVFDDTNKVTFFGKHYDPYGNIPSEVAGKATCTLTDPLFLNPCSYDSVSKVFDHAQTMSDRDWVAVGCDGLPYILGSRVVERYHTCPICTMTLKSEDDLTGHYKSMHSDERIVPSECKKYGNVLIIPGLGHYEINFTKALFKLLWPVCLMELAKLLGFRSLRALTYCELASNHHKSWQILQIFLDGTAPELLLPYVRHCVAMHIHPTVQGLYQFTEANENPNFRFLFNAVFTYVFALDLFRRGVRRNNKSIIYCAIHKLSALFYGLNMTQYQEIDIRRQIIYHQSPDSVKELIDNLSFMSQSGHVSKGEGGDFILESKNKRVKMWLPPGIATEQRWLRVYRNLPSMDKIKTKLQNGIDTDKDDIDDTGLRKHDNTGEVHHWRVKLRKSSYLTLNWSEPISLGGKQLDAELVNFEETCLQNKARYCDAYPRTYRCSKIFITPEDRQKFNDITQKTKAHIAKCIADMISEVADAGGYEESECLNQLWNSEVKCKTKNVYLTFHKDVRQVLEEIRQKNRDTSTDACAADESAE